jgi:hypothetical protein
MSKHGSLISVAEDQEGRNIRIVTETEPFPIALFDGVGNPIGSLSGAIDIHNADAHTNVVNRYIHQHLATTTTLAVAVSGIGTVYTVTVVDSTGFAPGDYVHIGNGVTETTHPRIISIAGNVITLDRRLDLDHAIGTEFTKVLIDLSATTAAGTIASPHEFYASPKPGEVWHITRLLFTMVHGTAGDYGLFGNLAALTNGLLIRPKINGEYRTFSNWKTNGDAKVDMFDVEFDTRSGGQGQYGTSGRLTFTRSGAIIRLDGDTGDSLEVYVQDDIRALGFFGIRIQGHLEDS